MAVRKIKLDEIIAGLPDGPWYRRVEIAGRLGVTPDAIRKASAKEPNFQPQGYIEWAGKEVYLWTEGQMEGMREHFASMPPRVGRPRRWTLEESADRRRRSDLARHFTRRARLMRVVGREDVALQAEARAAEIRRELERESTEREAQLRGP